ncbi:helix-turn-helix domain-containing protein [Aquisalibacillus elongatus]|uniref:Excisionase family DNA binding protein n=1 Tax=Aquisalibacillus elongatus TaxID=485577 RepID=A0A3N5CDJ9_9BACI|nr:helix-turn-helix domain-containing protein [Aquisalibacillus elongatus]RPF57035.1 excisionase family DNA binding protein [Aquisalibacillus elongatus]
MNVSDLPEILTAQDIADYLVISRRRVYELFQISVEKGGIRNFDIGNTKRVKKEDLLQWIETQINNKGHKVS